ncbi:hypothetical protein BDV25DRAFT_136056 [Aspergillus avenaceus]|uniref:Aminoglycoside phosphotransferase domain-containing protein n=1 Tax=Aspergillus avenaceus TaxID=36643 RepID=A0A5N6U736_ASPAV|nr:hypothetical protein BDV25DRAFT_136056 [Aspergillus avenaceus]
MNPYETDPTNIPCTDLYADVPLYGRYAARPDDFRIDAKYSNCHSEEALQHWASVIKLCNESVRIYPADEGGRDVFALGSIIVKSGHLHDTPEVDYSYADANEIEAIDLAKAAISDIKVPGRQVLIQERIPGVTLGVAWPYLSQHQKESFKNQARDILRRLYDVKPKDVNRPHTHIVHDPNILTNGRMGSLEVEIIFADARHGTTVGFAHNDLTQSNCIVDRDRIIGLIDWEMAGFFGWKVAGEVHRRVRTPQREHYQNVDLDETVLLDMMFWGDLYDNGMSEKQ